MAPLSLASCAACCSCSYAVPARPARFTAARRTLQPRGLMPWGRWPALLPPLQAAGDGGPPPESSDGDARVEALEAALRSRKGVKAKQAEAARSASAPRSKTEFAEWKEGGLFPEGWEQMDPLEKVRPATLWSSRGCNACQQHKPVALCLGLPNLPSPDLPVPSVSRLLRLTPARPCCP